MARIPPRCELEGSQMQRSGGEDDANVFFFVFMARQRCEHRRIARRGGRMVLLSLRPGRAGAEMAGRAIRPCQLGNVWPP